jgi:Ras family protein T1
MGIETPIPISVKLKDLNNIFCRVVHAAQRPHLSIPETEAGKASSLIFLQIFSYYISVKH